MVCLTLLLSAGCSKVKEEDDRADQSRTKAETQERAGNTGTGGDEDRKEGKTLKQASVPQFIPNGIRSVSLTKDGEEFLHISREPAEYKMQFDYWEILNPYDENATMNTEVMFEMFEELCSLRFTETVTTEEGMDTGIQDSDMGITVEYIGWSMWILWMILWRRVRMKQIRQQRLFWGRKTAMGDVMRLLPEMRNRCMSFRKPRCR